ncbi:methyl-accepting chemotaxis protein [Radiobacillus kanasensis]|uniref:methyl-accepting chemotaxis protein n=1 Tax=Radiobacillus kanasensis TaxID=2844358 RepID=UPI001E4ADC5E|nr:methyl-accepting chemotaxis protein [Radiobacillus kanasensis]UFU00596.1 methyl-accepting chemotaxis protein [Radiobacillus kanasensis]
MKNWKWNRNSIFLQLLTLALLITVVTGTAVGITSYYLSKEALLNAGKEDLNHLVSGSIATLDALNNQVESGDLTLEEAQEKARELLSGPKLSGEEGYDFQKSQFLYREDGYIVAYGSDYSTQVHPSNPIGEIPEDTANRENMTKGAQSDNIEDHYTTYEDEREETGTIEDKMSYMTYYEPWDWNVGIAVYQSEFFRALGDLKWYIIAITTFITILSVAIFYFAIRKKVKSLNEVTRAAEAIAHGEITSAELRESKDEIGQLATSFNIMSSQLKDIMLKLQGTGKQLLDSASDLSAVSEETSATGEEVGRAITEIASGTQAQASDLEDINQSVETLNRSIDTMNEQTNKIREITNVSEKASTDGQEIVSKLRESNDLSQQAVDKISVGITNLYNKSSEIAGITSTIESIAAETNLLALNASIEAARAGEHGKGFSVVADEIRKLAEQSTKATHQVQEVINSISEETEKTVMVMAESMNYSVELNTNVQQTEKQFSSISKSIAATTNALVVLTEEIAEVVRQNTKITAGIQNTSAVSEETAASVEQITSSVEEQIRAIANVAESAEQLSELNQELNEILKTYRLS